MDLDGKHHWKKSAIKNQSLKDLEKVERPLTSASAHILYQKRKKRSEAKQREEKQREAKRSKVKRSEEKRREEKEEKRREAK